MANEIITIESIDSEVITIDNVATEILTIETVEVITIEGVGVAGAPGPPGAGGVWGEITGDILAQTDLQTEQGLQDTAISLNTAKISFPEAPEDGNQYARKDAGWEIVDGGAVDSVNGKTGIVVIDPDDLDDSSTVNKFVTAAQIVVIDNTSGVNTGDQDISGIGDNANDITTINETAIFVDPASPQDVELNWKGNNVEYDALTPSASTIHFIVQLQTLLTATVTGDQNVEAGDTEIYSASYTGSADDVTYLWTVTGSAFANINGSDTGQTVTVDYTLGTETEDVEVKCVLSSLNAQDSVEDTLPVVLEYVIQWTQSFKITDTVNDVIYGIDPAVSEWVDYGTALTNVTQTNPSDQPSVFTGVTPADNYLIVDTNASQGFEDIITNASDFTCLFEMDMTSALGAFTVLLGDSLSGGQGIQQRTSNILNMRSTEGNDNDFPAYTMTGGFKKYAIIKEGSTAKLYVSGSLESTIVTLVGTFTGLDSLFLNGSGGGSVKIKSFKQIDRALTDQEAIDETTP